jgi:hypothetical protein
MAHSKHFKIQMKLFRLKKFQIPCRGNEVSTRHHMNYGQVSYPTLVDEIINFTKAEPLFGM